MGHNAVTGDLTFSSMAHNNMISVTDTNGSNLGSLLYNNQYTQPKVTLQGLDAGANNIMATAAGQTALEQQQKYLSDKFNIATPPTPVTEMYDSNKNINSALLNPGNNNYNLGAVANNAMLNVIGQVKQGIEAAAGGKFDAQSLVAQALGVKPNSIASVGGVAILNLSLKYFCCCSSAV